MIIFIYPDHHCLPFWSAGEQKENSVIQVVDPQNLDQWKSLQNDQENDPVSFLNRPMYPVLKGLVELECFQDVVAHISFNFCQDTLVCEKYYTKRCWIQFSTLPEFIDGVPQVFLDGKPLVENLWIADNGTYSPYEMFKHFDIQKVDPSIHTKELWKKWFIATLMNYRDVQVGKADQQIKHAEHVIALYRNFPKKEDVCL